MHWEAVFAHVSSPPQATPLIKRLSSVGFKGIQLERDYCDDWEVMIVGLDKVRVRNDFTAEAESAGFHPSYEPPDIQKYTRRGETTAVFGIFPTLDRANARQQAMAANGFRENSDIVRVSSRKWKVVVFRIPANVKASYAAQARRGGFRVTFEG